jgi:hypothetical protein
MPASTKKAQNSWSLVIPSCDGYNDVWPYLFHFLFTYWPDVPQPVYLVANHTRYNDARVTTIQVGEDRQWAANLVKALDEVPSEWVMMLLDDFLLNRPVDGSHVAATMERFRQLRGRFLAVDNFAIEAEREPGSAFCRVDREKPLVGLNATFWHAPFLREVCQPGLSIWTAEQRLKRLARENSERLYHIAPECPLIVTYVESVKGFFWKPAAVEFLAGHGMRPDLWRRPCPNPSDHPLARFTRSVHKRRMRLSTRLRAWRDKKSRTPVVEPLVTPK